MSLRASEAVIYERYGFGMAGEFASATVTSSRARPVRGAAIGGSFRFLDRDAILATVEPIYARSLHRRPGAITRPASWWRRYFLDALKQGTSSYVVVHEDAHGVADGYAHYDIAWNESPQHGGKGDVHEVIAVDDATELAVWGFLLDTDLVRTWKCEERPVDDIVREAVHDRRAYAVTDVDDEQWIRLDRCRPLAARPCVQRGCRLGHDRGHRPAHPGERRYVARRRARRSAHVRRGAAARRDRRALGRVPRRHVVARAGRDRARRRPTSRRDRTADTLFASRPLPCCGSFF